MISLADVAVSAQQSGLAVLGGFHPDAEDGTPATCRTLLLLGPDGANMWPVFRASGEFADQMRDPLDRWSKRVIGALADTFGGVAIFPSDRPYPPFLRWAQRTGRLWPSPVGLLVHEDQGLLVSFRGALALTVDLPLPASASKNPCDTCLDQPCTTACPARALSATGYDVSACHDWLNSTDGTACRSGGCAVRLSCPVGQGRRPAAQLAFHMAAFHPPGT
jgi:epoxyqueuosine reductase